MEAPKTNNNKNTTKPKQKTASKPKAAKAKAKNVAKPKPAKLEKPKTAKKPKTTKPKPSKTKKIKPAKTPKVKKVKVEKPQKVKVRKIKKTKNKKPLKQRIFAAAISTILILSLLVGVGSIFTLNDFAMTTIFSNNVEKSRSILEEAILANFNSRYLDMKIESSITTKETGYVNSSSLAYIKLIKYDNNTFGFTGTYEMSNAPYMVVNYKNGKFFSYLPEHNYYSQNTQAVRSALTMLMPYFSDNHILPTSATTVVDAVRLENIKSSFALSTKPVYFGQKFELIYNGMPTENEIYEIDHLGNLRKRTYIIEQAGYIYKSEISYLTANKIFELKFHPSFVI